MIFHQLSRCVHVSILLSFSYYYSSHCHTKMQHSELLVLQRGRQQTCGCSEKEWVVIPRDTHSTAELKTESLGNCNTATKPIRYMMSCLLPHLALSFLMSSVFCSGSISCKDLPIECLSLSSTIKKT